MPAIAPGLTLSEAGLAVPTPDEDALFVEEFVHSTGLKEEFALAAYHGPEAVRQARRRRLCNWLALACTVP